MSFRLSDDFSEKLPNRLEYTEIDGKQVESYKAEITDRMKKKRYRWTAIVTVTALLFTIFFILVAFLAVVKKNGIRVSAGSQSQICGDQCRLEVVETIPEGLRYHPGSPTSPAIVKGLLAIMSSARESIDIASSYWTLRESDVKGGPYPMAKVGEQVFDGLIQAAMERGIPLDFALISRAKHCSHLETVLPMAAKVGNTIIPFLSPLSIEKFPSASDYHSQLWQIPRGKL